MAIQPFNNGGVHAIYQAAEWYRAHIVLRNADRFNSTEKPGWHPPPLR